MAIVIRPMRSAELIKDDYLRQVLIDVIGNINIIAQGAVADTGTVDPTPAEPGTPIAPTAQPAQTGVVNVIAQTSNVVTVLPEVVALENTVNSHAVDLITLEGAVNSVTADVRSLIATYNALIETLRSGGTVQ